MTLWHLFVSFLQIGLFSIGGGYVAIPLIRSQAVELYGWLTESQFMDLAAIAEMTPGPIGINGAAFVGIRVAGLPGVLAAGFGFILPSLIIVSLLAYIYRRYREMPMLQSVLSFLRPAVVALIASAGINMFFQAVFGGRVNVVFPNVSWGAVILFSGAFFALRRFRANPILVMALCGAGGLALGMIGLA